jgi:mannonate dehydratase
MCFRWFGKEDPIGLNYINQIPGVYGIVSAIYDVPVGEVWPLRKLMKLRNTIEQYGLKLEVIESVPVHEDIKLGLSTRDKYITNYAETLKNIGKAKIDTVTYNFMAVFDWTRTDLNHLLKDGSKGLKYEEKKLEKIDLSNEDFNLPGWDTSYAQNELNNLLEQYQKISKEDLWEHLEYFLNKIIPVAERNNINLAIHPDDPPWDIFNLPRIITDEKSIERLINLVDSQNNGLAICSGSLGVNPKNNLPNIIRKFGDRIHFGHVRNIKITGKRSFEETAHLSSEGSLDLYQIMKAYYDIGFKGPIRPDHGRMIWNEEGKPGYGLYDRALGVSYLTGLWEAIRKSEK